jgi:DNA uptake protein ComE-like DNA-binding protein
VTQRHAADELSDQLMSGKSLLTCTKFWPGQAFTEVAAAMLGSLTGSLGVAAHDVRGNRALLDTFASAHRLHSKLRPKTEALWRTAGSTAAQRDMCSVTTMSGGAQGNRADALGVSGSASSRRGHSTAASSSGSGSNSSSGTSRATSPEAASSVSDLRSVPGVGPKNEQLLVASGHASLGALQQHFSKGVRGDTVAMSEYLRVNFCTQLVCLCLTPFGRSAWLLLSRSIPTSSCAVDHTLWLLRFPFVLQSDVGIRVKRHCNMIAQHLLHLQQDADDADKPPAQPSQQEKKLTLCVEGNISAGKSTFLRMLTHELTLHELVEVRVPYTQHKTPSGSVHCCCNP